MTVDQRERRVLQEALVNALGTEPTDTLMDYLPPVGWADVATKSDLEHHAAAAKSGLEHHAAATRTDLAHHRAETRAQLERHRAEVRAELAALEKRVMIQLHKELRTQFLSLVTVMSMLFGTFTAIIKFT